MITSRCRSAAVVAFAKSWRREQCRPGAVCCTTAERGLGPYEERAISFFRRQQPFEYVELFKMTLTSPPCAEEHRTDRAGWRRNTRPPPDRRQSIWSV
jgi:hypothetical protein